ncbi:hypothetical protein JIX56_10950 [Streptomyces sp. CA-210063]|uniref:hypothetical protein n=1 Tax=Streptomyces sp. CA-210063 TaxID=2801029 RepID=UPI00214A923C|nr:hypothetical protein [Streptomyces sp. CA-210063]UUU30375.1 hypothetical protein JIX56_10950 [Streptomyces sp. CA-210063]
MDYNLSGLSTREFEHVSQALAQEILGSGVSAFGDGKDGGREATFEGRVPYPSELEAWDGYGGKPRVGCGKGIARQRVTLMW